MRLKAPGRQVLVLALLASPLGVACDEATPPTAPAPLPSPTPSPARVYPGPETIALVAAFQTQGRTARIVEVLPQESDPFFAVPAARLSVDGENVYSFEYLSPSEAEGEASLISPEGTHIGSTWITWVSDPHFYQSRSLIVLYVGTSPSLLRVLEQLLGPQIAGA